MTREALMRLAAQLDEVVDFAAATGEGAAGLALTEASAVLSELALREAVDAAYSVG